MLTRFGGGIGRSRGRVHLRGGKFGAGAAAIAVSSIDRLPSPHCLNVASVLIMNAFFVAID